MSVTLWFACHRDTIESVEGWDRMEVERVLERSSNQGKQEDIHLPSILPLKLRLRIRFNLFICVSPTVASRTATSPETREIPVQLSFIISSFRCLCSFRGYLDDEIFHSLVTTASNCPVTSLFPYNCHVIRQKLTFIFFPWFLSLLRALLFLAKQLRLFIGSVTSGDSVRSRRPLAVHIELSGSQ